MSTQLELTLADRNRARFPLARQMIDELRVDGFTKARVRYASEGSNEVGIAGDAGVTPILEVPA